MDVPVNHSPVVHQVCVNGGTAGGFINFFTHGSVSESICDDVTVACPDVGVGSKANTSQSALQQFRDAQAAKIQALANRVVVTNTTGDLSATSTDQAAAVINTLLYQVPPSARGQG